MGDGIKCFAEIYEITCFCSVIWNVLTSLRRALHVQYIPTITRAHRPFNHLMLDHQSYIAYIHQRASGNIHQTTVCYDQIQRAQCHQWSKFHVGHQCRHYIMYNWKYYIYEEFLCLYHYLCLWIKHLSYNLWFFYWLEWWGVATFNIHSPIRYELK